MNKNETQKNTISENQRITNQKSVGMRKLTDRIFLAEQCWNVKTIFRDKRNNASEFAKYLHENYDNKYMIWRFCDKKSVSDHFRNTQVHGTPEFNIKSVLNIAKAVSTWLSIDEKNIAIIENKLGESTLAFICACITRFVSQNNTTTKLLEESEFAGFFECTAKNKLLRRYCNYFECLFKPKVLRPAKNFYQIIISCPDESTQKTMTDFKELILRIENEEKNISIYMPDTRIYRDDFYLIYTINEEMAGDVKFTLFASTKTEKKLFECNFNTFFVEDLMYRFVKGDMDVNEIAGIKNITVDIALKENDSLNIQHSYLIENNKIETFKNMIGHFNGKIEEGRLKNLIGFTKIGVNFFLLIHYGFEEAKLKSDSFLAKSSPKMVQTLPYIKKENEKKEIIIENAAPQVLECEDKTKYLKSNVNYEMDVLDEISEGEKKVVIKPKNRPARRGPPKLKKEVVDEIEENENRVFARRPLHFKTLSSVDTSIFKELEDLKVDFDNEKFEEWFCEAKSENEDPKKQKKKESENEGIIVGRRLFLMQLACKSLEKKGADLLNLQNFLYYRHETLQMEDLLNIKRLFLTEKENLQFKEAKIEDSNIKLNEIEEISYKVSNNGEIVKIVEILIFDRETTEELVLLKKMLKDLKFSLAELLENKSVKLILKHVLEMSNAVNYRYTKNRKKISSFRIECLKQLSDYKGKDGKTSLLTFLVQALADRKQEVISDLHKFLPLNRLKNEDVYIWKETLNNLIKKHRHCVSLAAHIHENEVIRLYLKNSLGFIYESLKEMSMLYTECSNLISEVIAKFSDNPDDKINEILCDFMDFFNTLKSSLDNCDV